MFECWINLSKMFLIYLTSFRWKVFDNYLNEKSLLISAFYVDHETLYVSLYFEFTGEAGVWVYKMTDNVQKKTEELYCFLWFKSNRRRKSIFSSMECPCDSGLLRFDPRYEVNRFDNENRLLCYASLLTGDNVVRFFF